MADCCIEYFSAALLIFNKEQHSLTSVVTCERWWCGGGVWCDLVWCGVVWCGVGWCGVVVWCGGVWYGGVVWCGGVVWWCGVVWWWGVV